MSDRFRRPQLATLRNTLREACAHTAFLPGQLLWPWVARSYGKLSARDLLALSGHLPTAAPHTPATAPAANTAQQDPPPAPDAPEEQPVHFPLPGFSTSKPPDAATPLNYTQPWNPNRARALAGSPNPANTSGGQNGQTPAGKGNNNKMRTASPWHVALSDAEYILVHELSNRYPDAYAWLVRRLCERRGIPVPDVIRPEKSPDSPDNSGFEPGKAA